MKTLVLGGYGNFGARICRALARDPGIALLIGGRDGGRADAMADAVGGGAHGIAIDVSSPGLADRLRGLGVELVVHAAGPFQRQGYAVATAAAAASAHYIDLADGRRFVCDFPAAMDAAFRAAGRCGISGASTVPALSSAVVDRLCAGWLRIDTIDTCIAPAQTAPRGVATMEAVLSYCGEPVAVWDDARWQSLPGWARPARVTFARLQPRLGALCDIPDLELFPPHYRVTRRVMFRAALEVRLGQRAFAALASLRAMRVIPPPARFARLLDRLGDAADFLGSSLGGMVVRVAGLDADRRPALRAWHIAADDDHGPEIPCMAAILLSRRLAAGRLLAPGARAATGSLALAEFEPEFARWGMATDTVDDTVAQAP